MRIRTIKPEFFTHEALYDLEKSTKLPVRIAFAGLWCAADKAGRFKWEPRRLGVAILPYDTCDFSRVLDALTTRGFVVKYKVGEAWFGCIPSFSKHQIINNRERESELPEPSATDDLDATTTRAPRVDDATTTPLCNAQGEGKGREGNMERNKEGNGTDSSGDASRVPGNEQAVFIANLFNRRLTTEWSEKELKAFKAAGKIEMDDLHQIGRYYAAERARGDMGIHRRDLLTFLNNFPGELDRARQHSSKPTSSPPQNFKDDPQ